jgi:hypothetical protein
MISRNQSGKLSRLKRADERAETTGDRLYGMTPDDVVDATREIQRSRSSFVMRWGKLKLHRVLVKAGVVYAMYDSNIRAITFFVSRETGVRISRDAKSASWGRKRSKQILLPPLTPEALKAFKATIGADKEPEGASVSEMGALVDKFRAHVTREPCEPFTREEHAILRSHMQAHIDFFEKKIQDLMRLDMQKNFDAISRYDDKLDGLNLQMTALDNIKPVDDPVGDGRHEDRRKQILETLDMIEKEMVTCDISDLAKKANQLAELKKELFSLIPSKGFVDRREGLHAATIETKEKILEIQQSLKKTDHTNQSNWTRSTEEESLRGLRARLKTLTRMHKALFASEFFMDDYAGNIEAAPDPVNTHIPSDDPDSIESRALALEEQIEELRIQIEESDISELSGHYAKLDLYRRELQDLKHEADLEDGSSDVEVDDDEGVVDIISFQMKRHIQRLQDHIKWFGETYDLSKTEFAQQFTSKQQQLNELEKELALHLAAPKEISLAETEPVQELVH